MSELSSERIAIAVATYNRNDDLCLLLESLRLSQVEFDFGLVVVDNSADGGAREIASASSLSLLYVHEPRPGIAAARNAALQSLEGYEAVIFIDDDEYVDENWFRSMYNFAGSYGAEVVFGPVVSHLPEGTPAWVRDGHFFGRRRYPTGTILSLAATNNVFVLRSAIAKLSVPLFDESYSVSGGSDIEFFSRLVAYGVNVIWCDEAVVYEHVPPERARLRWIWKRQVRIGNVSGRLHRRTRSRVTVLGGGLYHLVSGLCRCAVRLVTLRWPRHADLGPLARGVGLLKSALGLKSREYARLT